MAVNTSRSMNKGLREGATDGSIKKRQPNTETTPGNAAATAKARAHLTAANGFSYGGDATCVDGTHP